MKLLKKLIKSKNSDSNITLNNTNTNTKNQEKNNITNISDEESEKYKDCDIEYLPLSDRYYPRYKGEYLFYNYVYNNYTLSSNIIYCTYTNSEVEAKNILDKFLEFKGIGTKIIKLTENEKS